MIRLNPSGKSGPVIPGIANKFMILGGLFVVVFFVLFFFWGGGSEISLRIFIPLIVQ